MADDSGDPTVCNGTLVSSLDQRGIRRIDQKCTVGAVELSSQGKTCTAAADCGTGFCVDGRCCDTACGDSNTSDCQACSVAAGASTDGTCSLLGTATTCRPAAGVCDVAEQCSGTAAACPADAVAPAMQVCRPATSAADVAEVCDGTMVNCPADTGTTNNLKVVLIGGGFGCSAADGTRSQAQPVGFFATLLGLGAALCSPRSSPRSGSLAPHHAALAPHPTPTRRSRLVSSPFRFRSTLAAALLLLGASASVADAQQIPLGFNTNRYEPTAAGEWSFWVDHPWYSSTRRFAAGVTANYTHNQLILGQQGANGSIMRTNVLQQHFVSLHVDLAASFSTV